MKIINMENKRCEFCGKSQHDLEWQDEAIWVEEVDPRPMKHGEIHRGWYEVSAWFCPDTDDHSCWNEFVESIGGKI